MGLDIQGPRLSALTTMIKLRKVNRLIVGPSTFSSVGVFTFWFSFFHCRDIRCALTVLSVITEFVP